jgi:hypothetical protein
LPKSKFQQDNLEEIDKLDNEIDMLEKKLGVKGDKKKKNKIQK